MPGPIIGAALRVTVMTEAAPGRIVGYVTLSAAQIERAFLPKPLQRNRPDPVPVTLLGQLTVDKNWSSTYRSGNAVQTNGATSLSPLKHDYAALNERMALAKSTESQRYLGNAVGINSTGSNSVSL
ncbi:MAG: hypothetical protein WBX25_10485 [Rhodomicrobium sp.]